jgi:hypothetical protein
MQSFRLVSGKIKALSIGSIIGSVIGIILVQEARSPVLLPMTNLKK